MAAGLGSGSTRENPGSTLQGGFTLFLQPPAWLPIPSLKWASHLRLLQLQELQELILLVVVLGAGIGEDIDEGPRVGNFHSSLDGTHTHLWAVTTSLEG